MMTKNEMAWAVETIRLMHEHGRTHRDCNLVRDAFVTFFEGLNPRFNAVRFFDAVKEVTPRSPEPKSFDELTDQENRNKPIQPPAASVEIEKCVLALLEAAEWRRRAIDMMNSNNPTWAEVTKAIETIDRAIARSEADCG